MKSSTSWFCTSRKYSAMVSADSATRSRVPGGSSIWPKTSAVLSSTPDSAISRMRSLPSRVRSPTPANTEVPPKLRATRMIISWMSTVLPTPAPPNRPILPPLHVRGEQVEHLDAGLQHLGLRLEVGERRRLAVDRPPLRDRRASRPRSRLSTSPMALKTWPLVTSPTGTVIGRAGVAHLGAADQAVGRLHRDRPDHVVAQVLGDLEGQRLGAPGQGHVDVQRVEDLGHRVARELGVDDRADDPDDAADGRSWCGLSSSSHHTSLPAAASALAPPTISLISWVIAAWRAEFISRV